MQALSGGLIEDNNGVDQHMAQVTHELKERGMNYTTTEQEMNR